MLDEIFLTEGEAVDWEAAIRITSRILELEGCVKESFYKACVDREKLYPTGLPTKVPIALPHTNEVHVIRPGACLLRLSEPVKFKSMENPEDEIEVEFVFNIAISEVKDQLSVLGAVSRMFQDMEFLKNIKSMPIDEFKKVFIDKWRSWQS